MNAIETYFETNPHDNPSSLATRIGRSPSTLTRAIKGEKDPSVKLAREVEVATDGKLTAGAFLAACLEAQKKLQAREAA